MHSHTVQSLQREQEVHCSSTPHKHGCVCARPRTLSLHNEYLQNKHEEHSSSSLVPQAEVEGQNPRGETDTCEHTHAIAWSLSCYSIRSVAAGHPRAGLRRRGEEGKECRAQNALLARERGAPPCGGGTARYSHACKPQARSLHPRRRRFAPHKRARPREALGSRAAAQLHSRG